MTDSIDTLATVKVYPQGSSRYGETACVAGLRSDTEMPQWVRLFPVVYRGLQWDWHRTLRRIELWIPLAILAVVVILCGGAHAPPAFFQMNLQIIVILILAVALRSRAVNVKRRRSLGKLFVALTTVYLAWGEYESFHALIQGALTDVGLTSAVIAAGLAALFVAAMSGSKSLDDT